MERSQRRVSQTMRKWAAGVVLCSITGSSAAEDALTNEDVIRLAEANLDVAVIVAKIESSSTAFDTSVDALVALADDGVANEVVAAMLAAARNDPAAARATVRRSPAEDQRDAANAMRTAVPGSTFEDALRSGGEGPEMVVIPAGRFTMGCRDCKGDREKPVHEVVIAAPFALSVYEVTFDDYDRFTYPDKVYDMEWGRGRRPVVNVSWQDAQDYVEWLSAQTGMEYRLPSEAEWEYAARAGTTTKYYWGNTVGVNRANCGEFKRYWTSCGDRWDNTAPVGSFTPNGFGLYDMHGNVDEWVHDCWNENYEGAPSDGSAWLWDGCALRVMRSGAFTSPGEGITATHRFHGTNGYDFFNLGFRVVRTFGDP